MNTSEYFPLLPGLGSEDMIAAAMLFHLGRQIQDAQSNPDSNLIGQQSLSFREKIGDRIGRLVDRFVPPPDRLAILEEDYWDLEDWIEKARRYYQTNEWRDYQLYHNEVVDRFSKLGLNTLFSLRREKQVITGFELKPRYRGAYQETFAYDAGTNQGVRVFFRVPS